MPSVLAKAQDARCLQRLNLPAAVIVAATTALPDPFFSRESAPAYCLEPYPPATERPDQEPANPCARRCGLVAVRPALRPVSARSEARRAFLQWQHGAPKATQRGRLADEQASW